MRGLCAFSRIAAGPSSRGRWPSRASARPGHPCAAAAASTPELWSPEPKPTAPAEHLRAVAGPGIPGEVRSRFLRGQSRRGAPNTADDSASLSRTPTRSLIDAGVRCHVETASRARPRSPRIEWRYRGCRAAWSSTPLLTRRCRTIGRDTERSEYDGGSTMTSCGFHAATRWFAFVRLSRVGPWLVNRHRADSADRMMFGTDSPWTTTVAEMASAFASVYLWRTPLSVRR